MMMAEMVLETSVQYRQHEKFSSISALVSIRNDTTVYLNYRSMYFRVSRFLLLSQHNNNALKVTEQQNRKTELSRANIDRLT